jgi:hypothetical protein
MAGEGPPSTTFLLASAKSWMPTSVGMTILPAADESFNKRAGITPHNVESHPGAGDLLTKRVTAQVAEPVRRPGAC